MFRKFLGKKVFREAKSPGKDSIGRLIALYPTRSGPPPELWAIRNDRPGGQEKRWESSGKRSLRKDKRSMRVKVLGIVKVRLVPPQPGKEQEDEGKACQQPLVRWRCPLHILGTESHPHSRDEPPGTQGKDRGSNPLPRDSKNRTPQPSQNKGERR